MASQKGYSRAGFLILFQPGLLVEMYVYWVYTQNNTTLYFVVSTQDFIFPENAALPIGGPDKIHTHYLLEMHYDNPEEVSGKLFLMNINTLNFFCSQG